MFLSGGRQPQHTGVKVVAGGTFIFYSFVNLCIVNFLCRSCLFLRRALNKRSEIGAWHKTPNHTHWSLRLVPVTPKLIAAAEEGVS